MDGAGIGWRQAFANLDGGGFPGAVGPQEAEALALCDFKIDAVHGYHVAEGLAQPAQQQRGRPCLLRGRHGFGQRLAHC